MVNYDPKCCKPNRLKLNQNAFVWKYKVRNILCSYKYFQHMEIPKIITNKEITFGDRDSKAVALLETGTARQSNEVITGCKTTGQWRMVRGKSADGGNSK